MRLKHREEIQVARPIDDDVETENETFDGGDTPAEQFEKGQRYEEITVWNFLNVTTAAQVRGGNPTYETFHAESQIVKGGGYGGEPDYVTSWVAEELWHEEGIDLPTEEFDIEVVDVESEEVHLL